MKGIQHTLLSYAAAAVFLLVLWWAIALLLALPIVPTPDKVLVRLAHVFSRDIFAHAAWSLWRIAAGLSLAVCVGYPLGVLMGYFRRADRYLSPVVYLTYPIPKIALLPILMLLAGVGELVGPSAAADLGVWELLPHGDEQFVQRVNDTVGTGKVVATRQRAAQNDTFDAGGAGRGRRLAQQHAGIGALETRVGVGEMPAAILVTMEQLV